MPSQKLSLVALKAERDRTIAALTDAFTSDLFDMDEFDTRVGKAHEATTIEALVHLRSDILPADEEPLAMMETQGHAEAQEALVLAQPESKWVLSLLGGSERKGRWRVPKKLRVGTVLGGCEIDLREALIAPGVTEVQAFACLGGIEIIAPPGLAIECNGIGILGGFESSEEVSASLSGDDKPLVRITGVALLGGVEVSVREVGESSRQAKKRRKRERKALAKKEPKQLS